MPCRRGARRATANFSGRRPLRRPARVSAPTSPGGRPSDPSPSADPARRSHRPRPEVVPYTLVEGLVNSSSLLAAGFVVAFAVPALEAAVEGVPFLAAPQALALVPFLLAAALWWGYQGLYLAHYRRSLSVWLLPDRVRIRHGVFRQARFDIPLQDIRDLRVSRGPLERRFRVASLWLFLRPHRPSLRYPFPAVRLAGLYEADRLKEVVQRHRGALARSSAFIPGSVEPAAAAPVGALPTTRRFG